ncbi:LysR family transcriptional regulator [Ramlibacter pallidus]|uniref:LysR family transcriptional regulator n=1 Tax=Ramlibacter pallidus TaxID=2780087 RepID=A0ABR9S8M5_9BURK|nr:LysR family transcriptional regulator [Ramlibacter pallidus]MBE7369894.1 LysR family transcriptional regulator [Ramlibacter pallidus]
MLNQIDLARVDLNLLTLFEVVLAEGHVGRAAQRMHLTPSAVSHGLGRLRRLLNDPLFLRTPKGVVPTARAMELAEPIAQVLAGARSIVSSAEAFDAGSSTRRFTIGAPDGVSAVLLPPLLARVRAAAPGIALSVRQLLPEPGDAAVERAWRGAYAELEARTMDIAILPAASSPARFHAQVLYEEDFVLALRKGHALAKAPTLDRYCEAEHLVVSQTGDGHGFVDQLLAGQGRSRRVALTVPNFLFALSVIAETDLVSALPRRFVALHGARHGVTVVEPPLPLGKFQLRAVAPHAAMMDAGLDWLFALLAQSRPAPAKTPTRPPARVRK